MPLTPLADIVAHPSGWDSPANYIGQREFPGWYSLLTRTRDSRCLEESNWRSALRVLGGESDTVVIHRFGHWACGWWESLAVLEGTAAYTVAEEIAKRLRGLPGCRRRRLERTRIEEADRVWRDCYDARERIAYIRKHRTQFEFHGWADLAGCVRGRYFAGYAGELVDGI